MLGCVRAVFIGIIMAQLLCILLLAAFSLHQGEAIQCYMCSSAKDPDCKDPFQTEQQQHKLTHCTQDNLRNVQDLLPGLFTHFNYHTTPPEDFVCVKAVTREYDREVVVRSCSVPRADTFDVCSQMKSRDLSFCQSCTSDRCNGGLSLTPGTLLVSFLPVAVLALLTTKY